MTDQTTEVTPDQDRPTMQEVLDSITGFDETAITQAFGRYFAVLCDDATMLARAAIFTHLRRQDGVTDAKAKDAAMGMRMADVNDYFPDDDEIDPDAPDTPAGEDDSQLG